MNGYFYRSELNNLISLENVQINEMIFGIIKEDYLDDIFIDADSNLIKFAWESENKVAPIAKLLIDGSDNIVVIGYTFPLYNRLVDLKYFNNLTNSKRLYIQDPNSEQMSESYKIDFALKSLSESGLIKPIEECNSFFVPSNIFKR